MNSSGRIGYVSDLFGTFPDMNAMAADCGIPAMLSVVRRPNAGARPVLLGRA